MGPVKEYVLMQASKWRELKDRRKNETCAAIPVSSSSYMVTESEDMSKPASDVNVPSGDIGTSDDATVVESAYTNVGSWGKAGEAGGVAGIEAITSGKESPRSKEVATSTSDEPATSATSDVDASTTSDASVGTWTKRVEPSTIKDSVTLDSNGAQKQKQRKKTVISKGAFNVSKPVFNSNQRKRCVRDWINA